MDLLQRTPPAADHRIAYGTGEFQFGDLWMPAHVAKPPLVVFVHGGWWKSEYDLSYGGHLCAALRGAGLAVWSVEYRRVGKTGGGWPATFQDVAAGYDYVETLAKEYPIELGRVVAAGHSAGGQLAFWLAGRQHIAPGSPIREPQPRVRLRGVVSLAGAVDLERTIELSGNGGFAHDRFEIYGLMGGAPQEEPERYRAGDPRQLLPFNIPQLLIQGTADDQIPPKLPGAWAEKARQHGDRATVMTIPGASHFDVVDPKSGAWRLVQSGILAMIASITA